MASKNWALIQASEMSERLKNLMARLLHINEELPAHERLAFQLKKPAKLIDSVCSDKRGSELVQKLSCVLCLRD